MIEKIDFSIIRYANCWEDADLLLDALDVKENGRILSIASAGDNSFAFLAQDGVQVMAVDISAVQIALCEFKKTAIQHLNRNEYLQLIGYAPCDNRKALINRIKENTNDNVKLFIQQNTEILKNGIGYEGKFEKYFVKFRKYILPLVHNKKTIEAFFVLKDEAAQIQFYNRKWNTIIWRWLLKLFFSKLVLGRIGRDPEMLKEVEINVGSYIKERAHEHLQSTASQHNYLLQMMLLGKFTNSVPFYLREANYNKIQSNIQHITFFKGEIKDAPLLQNKPYNYANLSNIFEYMNTATFEHMADILNSKLDNGAAIAYWNLMVNRDLAQFNEFSKAELITKKIDNGFFYRNFNLSVKV